MEGECIDFVGKSIEVIEKKSEMERLQLENQEHIRFVACCRSLLSGLRSGVRSRGDTRSSGCRGISVVGAFRCDGMGNADRFISAFEPCRSGGYACRTVSKTAPVRSEKREGTGASCNAAVRCVCVFSPRWAWTRSQEPVSFRLIRRLKKQFRRWRIRLRRPA
jgi:hypothetical protein